MASVAFRVLRADVDTREAAWARGVVVAAIAIRVADPLPA